MEQIKSLLGNWIAREPTAGLWLGVVTVLLFGVTFQHLSGDDRRAWTLGRRLLEALTKAAAFAALLGMFYFLLTSSFAAFSKVYASFTTGGSLSNLVWQKWHALYGGTFTQEDLQVMQFIVVETQEVLQPKDPSAPPLYRTVRTEQPVMQTSLTGFDGRVTINIVNPAGQTDSFNGYGLSAVYTYDVVNPADSETRVEFRLPLSSEAKLYQDLSVKMNGEEVPGWSVTDSAIAWEAHMQPGEKAIVSIHYMTWGMDGFVFDVPQARQVTDFKLTVAMDTDNCLLLTQPENGGIQLDVKTSSSYKFITWTVENAILAPRLGVDIRQYWPYAPYQEMIQVLPYGARAALLFLCMLAMTLLICGETVQLRQVALAASLFALPFLVLMAGGLPHPASITPAKYALYQARMLPVLALPALAITFFALRRLPRLPLVLILALMAFFLGGYALVGLLSDEKKRNTFEVSVQAGMIAYVFLLALFVRVRSALRTKA
jgi:hypothetical protein